MTPMTLSQIADVVGGQVVHDTGALLHGHPFVDSRVAERGGLFVAIAGERVDGGTDHF